MALSRIQRTLVIPGATVKVDDVDKGVSHTYTTDGAGLYCTGSIVPDHYLITVTAPASRPMSAVLSTWAWRPSLLMQR